MSEMEYVLNDKSTLYFLSYLKVLNYIRKEPKFNLIMYLYSFYRYYKNIMQSITVIYRIRIMMFIYCERLILL